jgi:hypothetical protein
VRQERRAERPRPLQEGGKAEGETAPARR